MSLQNRIDRLEQRYHDDLGAIFDRIVPLLTAEELEALAPRELWSGFSDSELDEIERGERAAPEYELPDWVIERMRELATPDEWRILSATDW